MLRVGIFLIDVVLIAGMVGCGDGGNYNPPTQEGEIRTWYDLAAVKNNLAGKIVIRSPKSERSRRMVSLPPSAVVLFQEEKEKQQRERAMVGQEFKEEDLVFTDLEGKALRPDTVTHAWVKLVRRLGLNGIRLHDARHTHASLMLKQGVHPKIVQERLGHASIQLTLDTYSHVVPGLHEAAAAGFDRLVNATNETAAAEDAFGERRGEEQRCRPE